MKIPEYTKLIESKTFTDWKASHPDFKLAHCFFLKDDKAQRDWHFGFIQEKTQVLVNFIVGTDTITMESHTELAKKEDQTVLPLEIEKVTLTKEDTNPIIEEIVHNEKQGGVSTVIYLLQHIPMIGTIWNVTAVTKAYKTLNIKIDAQTGEVKLVSSKSLFDVQKNTQT